MFHETVGHIFISRHCTMRTARRSSLYICTHAVETQISHYVVAINFAAVM